jgi:hypothetical protein
MLDRKLLLVMMEHFQRLLDNLTDYDAITLQGNGIVIREIVQ